MHSPEASLYKKRSNNDSIYMMQDLYQQIIFIFYFVIRTSKFVLVCIKIHYFD